MGGRDGLHLSSSSLASSSACRGLSEVGNLFILYLLLNMFSLLSMYCKYGSRHEITNVKKYGSKEIFHRLTEIFFQEERRRLRDLRAEREARSLAIEKAYVHDVYEQVGLDHWDVNHFDIHIYLYLQKTGLIWAGIAFFSPVRQDHSGSCQYLRLIPEGFV